ncbi:hypothetical protein [Roseibium album]|uniref:hypothetical protein n=1 Tax=Roseibium album TaxID=311410 RepID=UPI00391B6747
MNRPRSFESLDLIIDSDDHQNGALDTTIDDILPAKSGARPWVLPKPLHKSLADEFGNTKWEYLTQDPSKVRYYGSETYFREGLHSTMQVLGACLYHTLHRHTAIVFKPDAVVARKILPALEFLKKHNFDPVFAYSFRYDRLSLREDWRYQLNQLSLERMRLNTLLAQMGDSLLVMLRDSEADRKVPASVRLQLMKGPSFPEQQTPKHLRFVLGSWSRLLKFVHTPDEPADLIREFGILFEDEERRNILRQTTSASADKGMSQVMKMIDTLQAKNPYSPLEFDRSAEKLLSHHFSLAEKGGRYRTFFERLKATIESCRKGEKLDWFALEAELVKLKQNITWDHLVLAAKFIHHSYENEPPLVPNTGVKIWRTRRDLLQV